MGNVGHDIHSVDGCCHNRLGPHFRECVQFAETVYDCRHQGPDGDEFTSNDSDELHVTQRCYGDNNNNNAEHVAAAATIRQTSIRAYSIPIQNGRGPRN